MATDIDDLDRKLINIANKLGKNKKIFKRLQTAPLTGVLGMLKQRIFNNGLNANNSKIGSYSTKPTFAGSKSFRTKTAANKLLGSKRKRKALKWVTLPNGKKVAVVEGGYKEIRNISGLQTSYIDLEFKGTLRKNIKIGSKGNDIVIGILDSNQSKKARGLEKKYNQNIFSGSNKEIKEAEKLFSKELDAVISELFKQI